MAAREPRLQRTARAEQDVIDIDIWSYIARHNLRAADRLVDILDVKSLALAQNPFMGPSRDDIAEGVRHFPVGNYLILYRVKENGVEVVRYVHGRRRLLGLI